MDDAPVKASEPELVDPAVEAAAVGVEAASLVEDERAVGALDLAAAIAGVGEAAAFVAWATTKTGSSSKVTVTSPSFVALPAVLSEPDAVTR